MLLVGVAIVLAGAGVAWAASRGATPAGGSTVVPTPPAAVPPQSPPMLMPSNTNSQSTPIEVGPTGGAPEGKPPNGNDLLNFAGKAGALVGGASAFTNVGKAAAAPIGVGVSAVAILAGAGSSLSVAGMWAAPIFLITVAIVTIVDSIARTAQEERWRELVIQVRDHRARGEFREALAIYERAAGTVGLDENGQTSRVGGEISTVSQLWPQPGDDWYNQLEPLGRPYPGFPGPPAPANRAEFAANPALLPGYLPTRDGKSINVRRLLAAAEDDVVKVRAWGLVNGIEGELPAWGPKIEGRAARPLLKATAGPRDISKWSEMRDRLQRLHDVRTGVASAVPWIARDCFEVNVLSPEELAVIDFKKSGAKEETRRRERARDAASVRALGGGSAAQAQVAADRAAITTAPEQARASEAQSRAAPPKAAGGERDPTGGGTSRGREDRGDAAI